MRQYQAPSAVSWLQLTQLTLSWWIKQGNRWWKSKISAVAEWFYLTFLVNNHPILHSSIRNMVSRNSLTFFSNSLFSISCHCSRSCAFPSLFKLWVWRVERTFLVAGHWYDNQSDNRHKKPLTPSLRMPDVQGRYSTWTLPLGSDHWSTVK